MERMKREDNFIRKSFSSRNAVPDKLLYKFKTRNQFFQRNLPTSFLFFPFLPFPPLSCFFSTITHWKMGDDRRGGDIRKFAKRVISRREERLKHRIRPDIRPSYNVWLKGNRWQSVKLKSQDPITSISISPEVGTNGCGEVTPRVNKRIRRNRSFHIRFSLFDVLEIVDGKGDTMGNFRTCKSPRTRCLEQRKPQNRSWKLDDLSLSLSLRVREIYLTNSWLSYLGKWNEPLERSRVISQLLNGNDRNYNWSNCTPDEISIAFNHGLETTILLF